MLGELQTSYSDYSDKKLISSTGKGRIAESDFRATLALPELSDFFFLVPPALRLTRIELPLSFKLQTYKHLDLPIHHLLHLETTPARIESLNQISPPLSHLQTR